MQFFFIFIGVRRPILRESFYSPRFLLCCDASSRTLTDGYRPKERLLPAENIQLAPSETRKESVRKVHFEDFDLVSTAIGGKCH